ncbi:phage antirepressor N-terminal domain-containing protein [Buttiauxella noackiae]|uniref:phage antirepressor N-terminal domain-containing protein n=1 Tax=Buttiauxella noackiae TaxID=82992 RepID=UPI0035A620D1
MSIATQISAINVPFHGDNLYLVSHDGEAQVPMRPVVEGMGLDWASQFTKIKSRFKTSVVMITIQLPGDNQRREVVCLNLRKLAGWLHTINVGKVRPELREKVARYQEECDDVLYQYWTKDEVKNPRKKTTVDERTPLRDAVNMLVGKKGLRYDDAYNMVHQRFAIDSIDELELSQIPQAVEYIHRVVLDGEFLGKQMELPIPKMAINYPIEWWNQYGYIIKRRGGNEFSHTNVCRFPQKLLFGFADEAPSAIWSMINELAEGGCDVSAVKLEYLAHRHFSEVMYRKLSMINQMTSDVDEMSVGLRISPPAKVWQ